ncbi:acetyl-CoA carboxylase biotin carboxylase subunit [Microbaculum marinisediminis]|uniref:Acetyl-CoA carboxylase biotin carboxylase subunit n=1 Tax=Microbaculum marinisediminis TaxID=2931392 RepID=A0AAW5R1X5_9HYPH|nr:biotin carboxylase N-terminal domain-containing protein [Microbaculum sp. A6E488]MCT8974207.1 acetyl-CoA carboxylase biotin carboxylase subunit [Microbaculum sp. A6E488]
MPEIRTLLVANRGEIACRIIATCRQMGIRTVAIYSEADAGAAHVSMADEAHLVGPAPARDSYLRGDTIIDIAGKTAADAIHPGYGFLSESPDFARAVTAAGLIWVGPDAGVIEQMGDKEKARTLARDAGVPVLSGSRRFAIGDLDGIEEAAAEIGYPVLVKAACGGGGIGMRRADDATALRDVVAKTQSMAERLFGDGTVYLERFVGRARHVEVQVFGFGDATAVHLFDRDCSVQRRFQKVIEEAPAPDLPDPVRAAMRAAAVQLAAAASYAGAGTVEFIYDVDRGDFSFLEMNTRIQVEHPATEMTTGIDLVRWQIEQAGGHRDPIDQDAIVQTGHAVEARIYAERPEKNFLPSPGTIETVSWPEERGGLRIDHAVRSGDTITPFYDPMIAKVIAFGPDRASAIARLDTALEAVRIVGVSTNVEFLRRVLAAPDFRGARLTTTMIEDLLVPA